MLKAFDFNPDRKLPRQLNRESLERHTVSVILVDVFRPAVAFVHPSQADDAVFIPPQGGIIRPHESVRCAAQRELREEIPSVRRPHPHAAPLVNWKVFFPLGWIQNPAARSGIPKTLYFAAFPTSATIQLEPDGVECDAARWVRSSDELETLLRPTALGNPVKAKAIFAACQKLHQAGWLH